MLLRRSLPLLLLISVGVAIVLVIRIRSEAEDKPVGPVLTQPGFTAEVVGFSLQQPTSIAIAPDGSVYIAEFGGSVWRYVDDDGDGLYEARRLFADDLLLINGIAFSPQAELYISGAGRVAIIRDHDGDTIADAADEIISDLPSGSHQNNGLAFGADGNLYITNGSTCNDCRDEDPLSATILQANLDGSDLRVFATGTRNPYDLAFDPEGRLWATDNGSDPPCNTSDELNLIQDGSDYGWPYGPGCDNLTAEGTPPTLDLGHNVAATGLAYYNGTQFPEAYRGGFFITLWGSNSLAPEPAGRTLVYVPIDPATGMPAGETLELATKIESPIDVAVDSDGSLLLLVFGSGRLYRIMYEGVDAS